MRPILAFFLCAGVAVSAEAGDFSRSGPYIGLGGTFGTNLFENDVEDVVEDVTGTSVDLDIDNSWGLNTVLGYRMLRSSRRSSSTSTSTPSRSTSARQP
jgi:hypothetical protein